MPRHTSRATRVCWAARADQGERGRGTTSRLTSKAVAVMSTKTAPTAVPKVSRGMKGAARKSADRTRERIHRLRAMAGIFDRCAARDCIPVLSPPRRLL